MPSGASNLGPTSKALIDEVKKRRSHFQKLNGLTTQTVPNDILFASGSGLDPHISPTAARLQLKRIAQNRDLNAKQIVQLKKLIADQTEGQQVGFLGEERINVLDLNLELDKTFPHNGQ